MGESAAVRILDVTGEAEFGLVPPCADARFDHRSCDYWEDDVRGSKSARAALASSPPRAATATRTTTSVNPFAPGSVDEAPVNPFAPPPAGPASNPFAIDDTEALPNPFAPSAPSRSAGPGPDAPRKLRLLARGEHVFGSYAKVLLVDEHPTAYAQFGPLSAYPRAQRMRELYPALPSSPLPAVITCIATTPAGRGRGLARVLVEAVCEDLALRGFAAIEAYPDVALPPDEASAGSPAFWAACGFGTIIADDRYPVMRRELA